MTGDFLMERLMLLIPLVLSLSVHEAAHAWAAFKLGDDTAALEGRLTLNPLVHMDPLGTFLLPLLGIPFGWAKPVPVQPHRFRRDVSMSAGMALTAAAGPLSNLLLAISSTVTYALLVRFSPDVAAQPGVSFLLVYLIEVNVALALFNMLPIPPLDGSRIVDGFMPTRYRSSWERVTQFAPLLLIGVIVFGGVFLRGPREAAQAVLGRLFTFISG